MDETTTTPTPAPTKAEIIAAERLAKREAKAAANAWRKAKNAEKRANGVIGTLHQMLSVPQGATKREVLDALTARFPERDPIGMATTVGIQLSRLQKKHGKIVSRKQPRGMVYGYETSVKFVPEGSPGVTIPVADLMHQAAVVADLPVMEIVPGDQLGTEFVPTPEPTNKPRKGGKKRR